MWHSISDQTLWCSLMFWLLYVSIHNYTESTMVARRVSFVARTKQKLARRKKTFSHQNTKGNAPKWGQKLKHSLSMRNSSKFIYIVFSVSAMCCKMFLQDRANLAFANKVSRTCNQTSLPTRSGIYARFVHNSSTNENLTKRKPKSRKQSKHFCLFVHVVMHVSCSLEVRL